jgi:hypothetical protein
MGAARSRSEVPEGGGGVCLGYPSTTGSVRTLLGNAPRELSAARSRTEHRAQEAGDGRRGQRAEELPTVIEFRDTVAASSGLSSGFE